MHDIPDRGEDAPAIRQAPPRRAQPFRGLSGAMLAPALLLGACALTPPERPASAPLPAQWQSGDVRARPGAGADAPDAPVSVQWWREFGSTELESLMRQVLSQNLDIEAAAARAEQARAAARVAGADLWPEISASADASRQGRLGGNAEVDGRRFDVGLAASYEVDFWGGIRASSDAAAGRARASEFDTHTVRLSVSAQAASAWLRWVSLRERLAIARRNLASAQRLLDIVLVRQQAGAETRLAVAQQRTLVASQHAQIARLEQDAAQARAQLTAWVGQADWPVPGPDSLLRLRVPDIDAGVPSLLLTRRPDIAAAEARLDAAQADVVAARAAMLPRLTLSAQAGGGNDRLHDVLANPVYALAAGLAAPIFNGGRLSAARDQALALRRELLAGYRQAILAAFTDTQIALEGIRGTRAQALAQAEALNQARETLALAESRYAAGAENQLVLLDAQRALYAAQDAAVQRQADRLLAAVDLYRALGGGWTSGVK